MPNELRKGFVRIGSSYFRLGSSLTIGVIEVPVLLLWLGEGGFGAVSLLGPSIGLASVVIEIVNLSFVREIGSGFHAGDRRHFLNIYHSATLLAIAAALIAAIVFAAIGLWVLPILQIDDDLKTPVNIFLIASAVFAVVRVLLSAPISMIKIWERFEIDAVSFILHRLGFLGTALVLWKLGPEMSRGQSITWYATIGYSVATFVVVATAFYSIWRDRSLFPCPWRGSRAGVAEIYGTFGWSTVVTTATTVGERIPLLVVNAVFGLVGSAIYGVSLRLGAYARMICTGISHGLESVSTRVASGNENKSELKKLIEQITKINAAVAMPATLYLFLMADPLIRLWIGRTVDQPELVLGPAIAVSRVFALAMGIRGIYEAWMLILYGAGYVRSYGPYAIAASLAIPVLAWVGAKMPLGEYSIMMPAVAFLIMWVLGMAIPIPLVGASKLGIPLRSFLSPLIRPAIATAPMAAFIALVIQAVQIDSILRLGLTTLACGVLYAPCFWFIVLNRAERDRILKAISNRLPSGQETNSMR